MKKIFLMLIISLFTFTLTSCFGADEQDDRIEGGYEEFVYFWLLDQNDENYFARNELIDNHVELPGIPTKGGFVFSGYWYTSYVDQIIDNRFDNNNVGYTTNVFAGWLQVEEPTPGEPTPSEPTPSEPTPGEPTPEDEFPEEVPGANYLLDVITFNGSVNQGNYNSRYNLFSPVITRNDGANPAANINNDMVREEFHDDMWRGQRLGDLSHVVVVGPGDVTQHRNIAFTFEQSVEIVLLFSRSRFANAAEQEAAGWGHESSASTGGSAFHFSVDGVQRSFDARPNTDLLTNVASNQGGVFISEVRLNVDVVDQPVTAEITRNNHNLGLLMIAIYEVYTPAQAPDYNFNAIELTGDSLGVFGNINNVLNQLDTNMTDTTIREYVLEALENAFLEENFDVDNFNIVINVDRINRVINVSVNGISGPVVILFNHINIVGYLYNQFGSLEEALLSILHTCMTDNVIKSYILVQLADVYVNAPEFSPENFNVTVLVNRETRTVTVIVNPFEYSEIEVIELYGHREAMHVIWNITGADHYAVFYRILGTTEWTRIDDMLIRKYPDFFRADIVGLKAGIYEVMIRAIENNVVTEVSVVTDPVLVVNHSRQGFAFVDANGNFNPNQASGAYYADGRLRSNAKVIYLTNCNKDTMSYFIHGQMRVGIFDVMYHIFRLERPINVRVIGKVTTPAIINANAGLRIRNMQHGITFEGIGEDANIFGWSLNLRHNRNVEIRNLAFMLTNSGSGDSIAIEDGNFGVWVHNNDFFYGESRGSDRPKGDGASDIVRASNITFSYNVYWDTGRSMLIGNGETSVDNISIHNNWFNHSDSRHPRVREATVHVFNNFFDGVSVAGIGSTTQANILSQSNVFNNTNRPMMISGQGTDTNGFFGSDSGGMLVSLDDVFVGTTITPLTHSASNPTQFDRVAINSLSERVCQSITTVRGNNSFSNFHLDGHFHNPEVTNTNLLPEYIRNNAGRIGNVFEFEFNLSDSTCREVNQALLQLLRDTTCNIVRIGDGTNGTPEAPEQPEDVPTLPEAPTPDPEGPATPEGPEVDANFFDLVKFNHGNQKLTRLGSRAGEVSVFLMRNAETHNSRFPLTASGFNITAGIRLQNDQATASFTLTQQTKVILYIGRTQGNRNILFNDVAMALGQNPNFEQLGTMGTANDQFGRLILILEAGTHAIGRAGNDTELLMVQFFDL